MDENPYSQHSHSNTPPSPPWGIPEVLLAFLVGYFLSPLLGRQLLLPLWPHIGYGSKILIIQLFSALSWCGILVYLTRRYGKQTLTALGLQRTKPWLGVVTDGLLCGAAMTLIGWILGLITQVFHWQYTPPEQVFPQAQLPLIALIAIFLAPIIEEITFRGFLQASLCGALGSVKGVLLTALLFMLLHSLYYGHWLAMAYVLLLGILLGIVRQITGSTLPCMIGHLINNLSAAWLIFHRQ